MIFKKVKKNKKKGGWSLEEISLSINRFYIEFGVYPSTLDFDKVDYMPTSRMIQRNFGGVVKLREVLNINAVKDLTKGEYRSVIAKDRYKKSNNYEEKFYYYLTSKFQEIRIHEHKILRPGRICCDFFVYTSEREGIAIDLFYAQDMYSLSRIVSIKLKRYLGLNMKIYFVLIENSKIMQKEIEVLISNRKIKLSKNIFVLTEVEFKNKILPDLI